MQILENNKQKFILTFIDEAKIKQINEKKPVIIPESTRDNINLDFSSMLDRQWTIEPQEYIFNSSSKIQLQKSKKIELAIKNFNNEAQNRGFLNYRNKNKKQIDKNIFLHVETVFKDVIPQQDIDLFLQSIWFQYCIKFFVILFTLGLILTDYSFRQANQQNHNKNTQYSISNKLSLHFQLFANCAFSLEIILKMFSKNKFFQNPWNIVNFIGCLSCWSSIYLDYQVYDGKGLFHVLSILKIILGIRIIQIFEFAKNPFQSFISSLPELGKIFFPYLIFISFYSILGLVLFSGANQYRCRETESPLNNRWPQVSSNLCGANQFHCSKGYCGNPYDYNMTYNNTQIRTIRNQFGLASFDNIGKSILTIYHYVFLSNWTNIKYKYSKFIHPYIATFYFFTLALILFFIMSNLNMITLSKSFIERQKAKQQKMRAKQTKKQDQNKKISTQVNIEGTKYKIFKVLQYIDIILVVFNSVVILIEYEGMKYHISKSLSQIDFALTIFYFIVVVAKTMILYKNTFKDNFMILDWVCLLLNLSDFILCTVKGYKILFPEQKVSIILRSIKIVRIIKILYFSQKWFQFQKTILKIFIETLNTIKSFILLLFCVMLILAFIGQNLFAFRAKFNNETRLLDMQNGLLYVVNFNSLYKALVAVTYLLENQRWTQTMYYYYEAVGWVAVLYFTVVVFIIHLLLTRLFIAIFLGYFRRNLQKKSENQQNIQSKQILCVQCDCKKPGKSQNQIIQQFLQNQSQTQVKKVKQINKKLSNQDQNQRIFWVFRRGANFFHILRTIYNSLFFNRCKFLFILVHCVIIIVRTNQDSDQKTKVLDIIQYIPLYFYVLQVLIGVLGYGFYWGKKTYLLKSKMNYINTMVAVIIIVSQIQLIGYPGTKILRRFSILKIITLFTKPNKQVSIVLDSISSISQSFIRMILMYIFLLIISCILPLKLGKNKLFSCQNYASGHQKPHHYQQCMMLGGDWIKDSQTFSNIFQSLALMYQVVTSQSWTYFIERFQDSTPWDLFFVLNFFICNTCLLNIFVGFTVQTYLSLKDQAYKLNLLKPNQRMWLLIRNSINQLIPVPILREPQGGSKFGKIAFNIISQPIYQNFIDILAYINAFIYSIRYYRAEPSYLIQLESVNLIILIIFMGDTLLKLQLKWRYLYLDNSRVQLLGFFYHIFYFFIYVFADMNQQVQKSLNFLSVLFLLLRCKKLIFRFTWCKTLLNSVIDILPKCLIIGALLAVILFFYVSIGMEVFKHTKPTSKSDGYTTGFNNFFTSLITLLKIVSNQSWFQQVAAFVRPSSPIDICFPINSHEDTINYPYMGCGTKAGYIYFITFHMIIALLVLNLLIATMVAAYDENYQKQYKSVNIFQLQDCLKLWQKYDPQGTGLILYKQFWRLSSQIAILFGISKKKLIKGKQKFLQQLDIDVCIVVDEQNNSSSALCYKFHDVLTKFSKIKLTVSRNQSQEGNDIVDFEIHPMIQRQIKDYVTKTPPIYNCVKPYKNLKSGQMKYFFGLLRKLRAWKIVAKKKNSSVISKLSHIIKVALQNKKKQEIQIKKIRGSISNYTGSSFS